jgi:hypothetical protein
MAIMMGFLLSLIGLCPHAHSIRERDEKTRIYYLTCDRCGRRVEAITRTKAERKVLAQRFPPIRPRLAQPQDAQQNVVTMPRKRRAR